MSHETNNPEPGTNVNVEAADNVNVDQGQGGAPADAPTQETPESEPQADKTADSD